MSYLLLTRNYTPNHCAGWDTNVCADLMALQRRIGSCRITGGGWQMEHRVIPLDRVLSLDFLSLVEAEPQLVPCDPRPREER